MKRFIILLVLELLALTGCASSNTTSNTTSNTIYIEDTESAVEHHYHTKWGCIRYYEWTNPSDGHDYYVNYGGRFLMHSPECKKCKKSESILDNSSLFDY